MGGLSTVARLGRWNGCMPDEAQVEEQMLSSDCSPLGAFLLVT